LSERARVRRHYGPLCSAMLSPPPPQQLPIQQTIISSLLPRRPTDRHGVRLASAFFCCSYLALAAVDTVPAFRAFAAYRKGAPLPPYIQNIPPVGSPLVLAIGVISLLQAATEVNKEHAVIPCIHLIERARRCRPTYRTSHRSARLWCLQ